ncbi:unnamed protein product [Didymodactylos carnosus]|uniref:Uncharacterized protein n=1 Tax=Didymodactylos carnosus TaxID=1234261 RepID=A0A8S2F095_9BILA|nr:unnamed protein product [Didymodactylos carnosus]CAF4168820.1 unnamed protein product [Didymodactylos carnosus]
MWVQVDPHVDNSPPPTPKRHRPPIPCAYIDKLSNIKCTNDNSTQCFHCNLHFCPDHLNMHEQFQTLKFRAQQENDELERLKVQTNRDEMHRLIDYWQEKEMEEIKVKYATKKSNFDREYSEVCKNLETSKTDFAAEIRTNIMTQIEHLSTKNDVHPEAIQELKFSLQELSEKIENLRKSTVFTIEYVNNSINIKKPNVDESTRNDISNGTKIFQPEDVEKMFHSPISKKFQLDTISDKRFSGIFDCSNEFILVNDVHKLRVFNKDKQVNELRWNGEQIKDIQWNELMSKFLILTNTHLFSLSPLTMNLIKIRQIRSIFGEQLSWMTSSQKHLFISHYDGEYIQHWSIDKEKQSQAVETKLKLLKRYTREEDFSNYWIYRIKLTRDCKLIIMNVLNEDMIGEHLIQLREMETMKLLKLIGKEFKICFELAFKNDQQWLVADCDSDEYYFYLLDRKGNDMKKVDYKFKNDVWLRMLENKLVVWKSDENGESVLELH